ncbi:MAG: hypothetical protein N2593_03150 [Patescibacteria group bacterium]|nr:hypothetical protein [Patescibacteria group bacterium]
MKIKIKPYLYNLIKLNIFYIFSFIFLFFLFLFVLIFSTIRIINLNNYLNNLKNEVNDLNNKVVFYNYDENKKERIEESIKILNTLLPNIEDYFSIIYSLERLSIKTGFTIVNYSIDTSQIFSNRLKISAEGIGDSQSFLNFLNEYNFSGARLITSDKVEFNNEKSGLIKINLTFYHKNNKQNFQNTDQQYSNLEKNIDNILIDIEKIKQKVNFDFLANEENIIVNPPKKSNPFE